MTKVTPVMSGKRILGYNIDGEIKSVRDWANHFGVGEFVFHYRLKAGWSLRAAVDTPVRPKVQRRS